MLFIYTLSAAIATFIISITAGAFTTKINQITWRFHFAENLASGIFLGAAMFHMLPSAEQSFNVLSSFHYPIAHLLCVLSLLMLFAIERFLSKAPPHYSKNHCMPMTVLSLHSLLEGAALGINLTSSEAGMIFIAIMAHKGLDSFALCTRMQRSALTKKQARTLLLIFSLMTPFGIVLASSAVVLLQSASEQLFQAVFNALGSGAFLYLAIAHQLSHPMDENNASCSLRYLSAMSLGLAAMAILAFWV